MFGELVGIWIVTEWMAQGRKSSGVELVEVGPGRGTLMDDMLRVSIRRAAVGRRWCAFADTCEDSAQLQTTS